MTITNERLRELATKPHDGVTAEERQSIAAELLAARERIEESHNGYHDDGKELGIDRPSSHLAALDELLTEKFDIAEVMVRQESGDAELRASRDAAIARADGLAADLAACVVRAEKDKAYSDALAERDAARAEVKRLRAELDSEGAQAREHERLCNARVIAAEDDAIKVRHELGDLRAYRDRTEAALVEVTRQLGKWGLEEAMDFVCDLGLARDAKGGQ